MYHLYTFQLIIFRNSREIFIDVSVTEENYEDAISKVEDYSKELIQENDKVTFALKSVSYNG